jgi:hypothetical protein
MMPIDQMSQLLVYSRFGRPTVRLARVLRPGEARQVLRRQRKGLGLPGRQ